MNRVLSTIKIYGVAVAFFAVVFTFCFAVGDAFAAANLVPNPSLETANVSNPALPDQWLSGVWGINTTVFTYPAVGTNGGKAAKIDISSYTNGDAKWYFGNVPVTAGQQYVFQDSYMSTVATSLAIQYTDSTGVVSYDSIFTQVPASPSAWGTATVSFTPKDGTVFVTIFHIINSVGSLTVDDFSLALAEAPLGFDQGMVSLTFDDGWVSQINSAKPILDAANMKATFYIISHTASGYSIANSSFETAQAQNPQMPDQWTSVVSGENSPTFVYPAGGTVGARGAGIALSSYSSGYAAWQFPNITIIPDMVYAYTDQYQSDATTQIVAEVTLNDGTVVIADVVDDAGNSLDPASVMIPPASVWTQAKINFYIQPEAKSVRVTHRLISNGTLTIDDVAFGGTAYMTAQDVQNLQAGGHEIGSHTQTHPDLTVIPSSDAQIQIGTSLSELKSKGAVVSDLAYPQGTYNDAVKQLVIAAGYSSARTIIPGFNQKSGDRFALMAQSVNANTTIEEVKAWIDSAKLNKTWLILIFHDVVADTSAAPYGVTPTILQDIASYLAAQNISVVSVNQGVTQLSGTSTSPILTSINLTPVSTAVSIGGTQQFTASPVDQFGNPITSAIAWSSSDPIKGTIDSSGLFTALSAGSVSVTASSGSVSASVSVTIGSASSTTSNLVFNAGWNLVTLPLQALDGAGQPVNYTAENFGRLVGADTLAAWQSAGQQYNSHIVGLPLNDFTISNGQGIFVHVTSSKSVAFSGSVIPQSSPIVATGWNLLGWNNNLATTADNFGRSIASADVVAKYDSASARWVSHVMSVPLNDFAINQGDGIFIHRP